MLKESWNALLRAVGDRGRSGRHDEFGGELSPPAGAPRTPEQADGDYQLGPDDGIFIHPMPVTLGQRVTVAYEGLLAKAQARNVYLHYGFGPGPWRDVQEVPMRQVGRTRWETEIEAAQAGRLEFCFRDSAHNWDNNAGRNWSVQIHSGGGAR